MDEILTEGSFEDVLTKPFNELAASELAILGIYQEYINGTIDNFRVTFRRNEQDIAIIEGLNTDDVVLLDLAHNPHGFDLSVLGEASMLVATIARTALSSEQIPGYPPFTGEE